MDQPPIQPHYHAQQEQQQHDNQQQQQQQQQVEVQHDDDAPQVEEQQQDDQQQDEVEQVVQPPTASDEMKRAIYANDRGKINSLVDGGESPNSVDELGDTILMRALGQGKFEAAEVLFGLGAKLSDVNIDGSNVLHSAAAGGDLDCIALVFEKTSIDVNSTDDDGTTPVMEAFCNGELEAAKVLVERGSDLLCVDNDGWNALHYAAEGGDLDCVEWLLANAAIDVNSVDLFGEASIAKALSSNELNAANLLVEKGANLFMKNKSGKLAIDTRVDDEPDSDDDDSDDESDGDDEPDSDDEPDGEQLGPQVLEHAKGIRWSAAKEFLLLSTACQSPDRRKVAIFFSMDDDVERVFHSARLERAFHSAHLAASVIGDPGLSRLIASYIMRTDIIVRDRSIPLVKGPDAVKRRIETALLKASTSSDDSTGKRTGSD
jgi:ankyrin repeat protein